jgi:hypothetical protein
VPGCVAYATPEFKIVSIIFILTQKKREHKGSLNKNIPLIVVIKVLLPLQRRR